MWHAAYPETPPNHERSTARVRAPCGSAAAQGYCPGERGAAAHYIAHGERPDGTAITQCPKVSNGSARARISDRNDVRGVAVKLTLELDDSALERLADMIAARVGNRTASGDDPLIGPKQAGISPRTWRRAVKSGALPAVKIGRELRARRSAVDAWLGANVVEPVRLVPAANDSGAGEDEEIQALLEAGKLRVIK